MLFKLAKEKDIIFFLKKDEFFVISPIVNVIVGVGVDFHYLNLRSNYVRKA